MASITPSYDREGEHIGWKAAIRKRGFPPQYRTFRTRKEDEDKIRKVITEDIPARVAQDKAYQNALANSDKQNAKLEHDKALNRVVLELLSDHTELFKQFSDNPNFKRWLTDTVFDATYQPGSVPPKALPQMGAGV
jgi:type I restriction enzyme R subunit